MLVSPEDILVAPAEVRVHLAGQQGVLRYVRPPRVAIERQDEQGGDADHDAQQRQIGGQLEDPRVAPETQ